MNIFNMQCNLLALKHPAYCNIHCVLFKVSIVSAHVSFQLGYLVMLVMTDKFVSDGDVFSRGKRSIDNDPGEIWIYCKILQKC